MGGGSWPGSQSRSSAQDPMHTRVNNHSGCQFLSEVASSLDCHLDASRVITKFETRRSHKLLLAVLLLRLLRRTALPPQTLACCAAVVAAAEWDIEDRLHFLCRLAVLLLWLLRLCRIAGLPPRITSRAACCCCLSSLAVLLSWLLRRKNMTTGCCAKRPCDA